MSQSRSSVSLHSTKKDRVGGILQVTVLTPDDVLLIFEKRDGVPKKIGSKPYKKSGKRFSEHRYFLDARSLARETFNPKAESANRTDTWHAAYDLAG